MSQRLKNPEAFSEMITHSPEMFSVFDYLESVSPSNQPVLITGETGVGKELAARCIHRLSGVNGSLVVVNVAGLDDNMFSDSLFGHVKGAFTNAENHRGGLIERAGGGTLFLDEIGDLSHASQVKLLRLIQEGEYFPLGDDMPKYTDARILAATNEDLWSLQKADRFRKDLNYRLRTHHVNIPPLRKRMEDIPLLVEHFLKEAAQRLGKEKPRIPTALHTLLRTYSFPGNIRELRAMVFDAVSRNSDTVLHLDPFREHIERHAIERAGGAREANPFKYMKTLPTIKEATRMLVEEAMNRSASNQSVASKILGISQPALSKRLKKQRIKLG